MGKYIMGPYVEFVKFKSIIYLYEHFYACDSCQDLNHIYPNHSYTSHSFT